jgi:hypothetical protein
MGNDSGPKIRSILKNIFFPSFTYRFSTCIGDLHRFPQVKEKIVNMGGGIVQNTVNGFQFEISSSKVLNKISFGKVVITVSYKGNSDFDVGVNFLTQKIFYYTIAVIISLLLLASALLVKDNFFSKIAAIPFLYSSFAPLNKGNFR